MYIIIAIYLWYIIHSFVTVSIITPQQQKVVPSIMGGKQLITNCTHNFTEWTHFIAIKAVLYERNISGLQKQTF